MELTIENLFLNIPTNKKINITTFDTSNLIKIYNFSGVVNMFCIECNQKTSFKITSNKKEELRVWAHYMALKQAILEYTAECILDGTLYKFIVKFDNDFIVKIAQYPEALVLNSLKNNRYVKILGKEKDNELKLANMLYTKNLGIGSMTYLRRIYEHIVNEAHQNYIKDYGKKAYEERDKMSFKIEKLGEQYLPQIMVTHSSIYGIISKGIHELSEDDCISNFQVLFDGIILMLEEKIEKEEEEKRKKENSKELNEINALLRKMGLEN